MPINITKNGKIPWKWIILDKEKTVVVPGFLILFFPPFLNIRHVNHFYTHQNLLLVKFTSVIKTDIKTSPEVVKDPIILHWCYKVASNIALLL